MNEIKRTSHDEVPNGLCKRQRLNKPARVTSLAVVDISRALGAIPGEFGAVLAQKILEMRVDGDHLLGWLNSIEAPAAEEPIATDVLCKHSHLFLPYLDRVSWDRLCIANRQIYNCSRSVSLLWPQKIIRVGSPVNSVAISSDGEYLASGSDDGIVRFWNGRNGSCTLLEGHTECIISVAFSPHRNILASGSLDQSIRLWKLDDQSHRLLEGHNASIRSIAFSPSGLSLASVAYGGEVRLWDITMDRCARIITRKVEYVRGVAFSPDGATLAVGGSSPIHLWDLEADNDSGSPSNILKTNRQANGEGSLVYSPNGNLLASVCGDIEIYRLSDGSLEKTLTNPFCISSCAFSPNGELVASGNENGLVRLWNMNDRDDNCCLAGSPHMHRDEYDEDIDEDDLMEDVGSVAFTPNGQTLASGGQDGTIFLWDTRPFL